MPFQFFTLNAGPGLPHWATLIPPTHKKLYNINHQIVKDGVFENYRLMDGKYYKYDENGLLTQIMVFKDGKYIGDGVIADNDN